ncbi:Hpt domain-containing protein [bacterium]|nr:Hpt domain-containing protein [bacterium]
MIQDADLFDREKALKCFGNEAILREVLKQFLNEVDPMLARLRQAVAANDREEVRKAVHWFRGGLSYLFSHAAERACLELDEQTQLDPLPPLLDVLDRLEAVMRQLQQHVQE